MNPREKLYYLVEKFIKEEYHIDLFCDEFTVVYNTEVDYNVLNNIEKTCFAELCEFTARYSPVEEDLAIPNVYFNAEQVKDKANYVYNKLMSK
ncbi:hypothetical protein [Clostridium kluyveri]|uniref:Colicin D immunity protein domain-containing protein n=1 Tax=Clostridium kluyveri TaxID=1534 RepID=A0A1L5FCD3_CLOKL|nr:hypothetical protein [Clostridium kluyveri]APM40668.1 hypothetical protein BS101_19020 [Clostridium kluyveri]UZQ49210.1 hypothetical protein OP486_14755 [Clostridium kluyveri]